MTNEELWQLYDEQAQPIPGKGATKDEAFKGLLHAASHVWLWRTRSGNVELLLQKRAPGKLTFPNLYDISAAGHIDLGEEPLTAAIREAQEEIGLEPNPEDLQHIGTLRRELKAEDGSWVENEWTWIYALNLDDDSKLVAAELEVTELKWETIDEMKQNLMSDNYSYVPQGNEYYTTVFDGIEALARQAK